MDIYSIARETARYVAGASAAYLSVTAINCPCSTIYECHALPAAIALTSLSAVTIYGIARSRRWV